MHESLPKEVLEVMCRISIFSGTYYLLRVLPEDKDKKTLNFSNDVYLKMILNSSVRQTKVKKSSETRGKNDSQHSGNLKSRGLFLRENNKHANIVNNWG